MSENVYCHWQPNGPLKTFHVKKKKTTTTKSRYFKTLHTAGKEQKDNNMVRSFTGWYWHEILFQLTELYNNHTHMLITQRHSKEHTHKIPWGEGGGVPPTVTESILTLPAPQTCNEELCEVGSKIITEIN